MSDRVPSQLASSTLLIISMETRNLPWDYPGYYPRHLVLNQNMFDVFFLSHFMSILQTEKYRMLMMFLCSEQFTRNTPLAALLTTLLTKFHSKYKIFNADRNHCRSWETLQHFHKVLLAAHLGSRVELLIRLNFKWLLKPGLERLL